MTTTQKEYAKSLPKPIPYGFWTIKENVLASARPFETVSSWKKAYGSAWNSACARTWLDEATAHMRKLKKNWSKEELICDARRFPTKKAWRDASGAARQAAQVMGIHEECCAHMTPLRRPKGGWKLQDLLEKTGPYVALRDFIENEGAAYHAAHRQGMLTEVTAHMVKVVSYGEYVIRAWLMSYNIEFECEKVYDDLKLKGHLRYDFYLPRYDVLIEYHGAQHFREGSINSSWRKKRNLQQIKESDIAKSAYATEKHIPLLIISDTKQMEIEKAIEEWLRRIALARGAVSGLGQRRELVRKELVKLARSMGNWTKEMVIEDTRQYTRYRDWMDSLSYAVACRRGWLKELGAHLERDRMPNGFWTLDTINEVTKLFTTFKEFRLGRPDAYMAACRLGISDQIGPHLRRERKQWITNKRKA